MGTDAPARADLYETDFAAWAGRQADLLRAGRLEALDRANLIEELESLGRSERREIESRLIVLLTHLAEYRYRPERRSRSWLASIAEQRDGIALVIAASPSLRRVPAEALDGCWRRARRRAALETGMAPGDLPEACPFAAEEILDEAFLPG